MAKETFIMKNNFLTEDDLELFEPEEIGYLMIAWSKFINTGELPNKDTLAKHLIVKFNQWKEFYQSSEKKYEETCEKRREAGKQGGRPKKQMEPNAFFENQNNPNTNANANAVIDKEKEDTIVSSKEKSASRFIPPTVAEVREYCQERRNNVDPETFVDFYTGKGWMVGKNKMKDWKAAVRTWEKNRGGPAPGSYKPRSKLDDLRALYKEMENEGDDYEKERNGYMLGLPF